MGSVLLKPDELKVGEDWLLEKKIRVLFPEEKRMDAGWAKNISYSQEIQNQIIAQNTFKNWTEESKNGFCS